MNAIVFTQYGTPDVLHLQEVAKPVPQDGEVLIEVQAASVNSWDWDLLRGTPFVNRMMSGLFAPKKVQILGADVSGRVAAVGRNVTRLQPGDEVFGDISGCGFGAFAQFVCARAGVLARKPSGISFEEAAAIPQAGVLALQGLRQGLIRRGLKVLLNGAGGGVGTFAVQIAKELGAHVTGVDRAEKLELLRSLGADRVIDYAREDFTRNGQRYDLILDVVASRSVLAIRRALSPEGVYVVVGGSMSAILQTVVLGPLFALTGSRKLELLLHKPNPSDLDELARLVEAGKVKPVIDRCYPLSEAAEAMRYFGAGHTRGKIVISLKNGRSER